jgi:hypothetical protein
MSSTPPLFPDFPRQPIRKISPYIPSILITTDGQELVYREYAVNENGRIIIKSNGTEYPIIRLALLLHKMDFTFGEPARVIKYSIGSM